MDDDDDSEEDLEMEMQQNKQQQQQRQHLMSPRRNFTGRTSPGLAMSQRSSRLRPCSPLATSSAPDRTASSVVGGHKLSDSPPRLILNPPPRPPRSPRIKVRKATQMLFERPVVESPRADVNTSYEFQRITVTGVPDTHSLEAQEVGAKITRALALRDKYLVPMPTTNWGGLDPELYSEFMQEKQGQQSRGHKVDNNSMTNNNNTLKPFATPLTPTDATTDTKTNQSSTSESNVSNGGMPVLFQQSSTSSSSSTGARQRLRRRMDVPYNPYLHNLDHNIPPDMPDVSFQCRDGVFTSLSNGISMYTPPPVSVGEFYEDLDELLTICNNGPVRSFAYTRLKLLEIRFKTHVQLNRDAEREESAEIAHRDFYNVRKVDTHIHHSACMNAKHLLRFIKHKLRFSPDEIVIHRDGSFLTLSEVFCSLNLTAYDLSIDTLDMHAHYDTFHRFDRFNLKYNPCGQSRLREIFLKYNNLMKGRYLADITKEVFSDVEKSKYQLMEPRISIYGRSMSEWSNLGAWTYDNRVTSKHIRWMVQIPRLYGIYKKIGLVNNFQDMLNNIFLPLFRVTKNPGSDLKLHWYLKSMVAFDCVDDESKAEPRLSHYPSPSEWDGPSNPPYSYWMYYLWVNLKALNEFRQTRGMNTFAFRPHAGEAGAVSHLGSAFMLCHHINHGVNLRKNPTLQYLYYLKQIGVAMSPLSNNRLFLSYDKNPFPTYFQRGLNISLSTDDPLQLHHTKDALLEEYSVALQVYGLTSCDLCELARNSVLQSGFEHPFKVHFLGENYMKVGPRGNDIHLTNVPNIRLTYRHEILTSEKSLVRGMFEGSLANAGRSGEAK